MEYYTKWEIQRVPWHQRKLWNNFDLIKNHDNMKMKRDNLSQHELKEKSLIFHLAYKEISCVDNLFARLNYHRNLLLKIQSRANDLRWDKFDHFWEQSKSKIPWNVRNKYFYLERLRLLNLLDYFTKQMLVYKRYFPKS